jgi:hypothetical protein
VLQVAWPLEPAEAAAVAVAVTGAEQEEGLPAAPLLLDRLWVTAEGALTRAATPPTSVPERLEECALVLRAALPDPGQPGDSAAADLLRHLGRAAMAAPGERVFTSDTQFCETLRPFTSDGARLIRGLFDRWQRSTEAASVEATVADDEHVIELVDVPLDRPTPWDADSAA